MTTIVIVVAAGIFADRQNSSIAEQRARATVQDQLSVIRAKLEGNMNSNIQLVRGLVGMIASNPELDSQQLNALGASLFEQSSQLRSIAVAPDLVVSMIYPLKGNERAMGLNYRTNDAQRDAALRARDTGKLVLAGPVDLVQGGQGFVGRFPIFTGPDHHFWGIISAVIDVDRLYADSGLLSPVLPLRLSITGKDALGGSGKHFYGPVLDGQDDPVTANVLLPAGTWQISAVPKGGWSAVTGNNWWFRGLIVLAWALVLIPILGIARLVEQRQRHIRELDIREAELTRLSKRLSLALETSKLGVWEFDLVSGDLLWDDRMNELYGWPADGGARGIGNWESRLHPDDAKRARADFDEGLKTGAYSSDFRVRLAGGEVRWVRTIGSVYAEGDDRRIVGVNWDVSKDVALHEDLVRAKSLTEAHNRELEAAKVRIEHNALHDSLTGLPNRRYLDEMLKANAQTGFACSGSIGLLHIDLDRFKQINDTLGHATGDAMLIHAAQVLVASAKPGDFVARIGGDEFVVMTGADGGDAQLGDLAEAIVRTMSEPVNYEGHECRFGVSIGIATESGAVLDVKRLLIDADIALYRAKARGRNRFEFFTEALQAEVVTTKRVADEILSGLERSEFVAYYQPQFDAHSHDLVGVEALARWRHPDGLRTPDKFLHIAEDLNVVATIDRLMLEQTLTNLDLWEVAGVHVPRASVNVSLRRLHDEDLIKSLRTRNIQPGRMSFELVESIYLDESDDVVGWNIDQIKELGIDIEIDDFGTGYASIVSLQKLRPARLKIDKQLVSPIVGDPTQRRLVQSIVDIGKSLGIEVVAEGVETMAQAAILRDLGCDILQGYAFAKPMSSEDLVKFVRSQRWRKAG
ncbi:EAL domain-containing protein [Devosia sp.]|uniref:bifunctional diguanylate cyclase/phosphodiesterase n=1 Tax=Devosia sp. TaxID=1871048 RepID=UPI003262ED94